MAEHYSFFDPVEIEPGVFDREYNAQEFTDYFGDLITTGIMKGAFNQLEVTTNGTNMVSSIDTGVAFIEGKRYFNDSPLELTHDTETLGKSRIDRIVIRMSLSTEARYVRAFIKKGVASTNPVPPSLQRDNRVYEISLAQVLVVGGQTYIGVNDVTDERGKDIICPWAGSNILPNFNDEALADLVAQVEGLETQKGTPNGVATLDETGNVPTGQLGNVPLPQDASTTRKGIVQLNNSISSTSTTQAATANAVKQVNDKWRQGNVELGSGAKANLSLSVAVGTDTSATGVGSVALGLSASSPNDGEGVLGSVLNSKWKIAGDFSVSGSKNFEIPHPNPDKKHTHVIRHGAVESPTTGDTLYRYEILATEDNQTVELQLPDYFEHLNTNVDVWVNPHRHFGRAFGEVIADKLLVTCEKAGVYKALVIGTRNDDNVQEWHIKGVEREIGESWLGETYVFEIDEITEVIEIEGVIE